MFREFTENPPLEQRSMADDEEDQEPASHL